MTSQQASSGAASDARQDHTTWRTFLCVLLGRLRVYFMLVEQSLRTEYVYEKETVDDWLKTLRLLDQAFFPIYQLLHQSSPSPELTSITSRRVIGLRRMLAECVQVLEQNNKSAVEKLYSLLHSLADMRRLILSWQQELAEQVEMRGIDQLELTLTLTDVTLTRSALLQLQVNLAKATEALENVDENGTCMALRRAYFLLYYVAIIHPTDWNQQLHTQVEELHCKALNVFSSGTLAYERIQDRQHKLQHYDLKTLQEFATQFSG